MALGPRSDAALPCVYTVKQQCLMEDPAKGTPEYGVPTSSKEVLALLFVRIIEFRLD